MKITIRILQISLILMWLTGCVSGELLEVERYSDAGAISFWCLLLLNFATNGGRG